MKGLVIDEPWISLILEGRKVWEMRSRPTQVRGPIALIRKGSGQVIGTADVTGTLGPLGVEELRENASRHCVPMIDFESGRAIKWTTAWLLEDASPLAEPVPYRHPFGAVTWVNLEPEVSAAIRAQMSDHPERSRAPGRNQDSTANHAEAHAKQPLADGRSPSPQESAHLAGASISELVPIAKDGSWFGPHVARGGVFQIGEKGDEVRISGYQTALAELRAMDVPRWRRPNAKGNWGIVAGVRWDAPPT